MILLVIYFTTPTFDCHHRISFYELGARITIFFLNLIWNIQNMVSCGWLLNNHFIKSLARLTAFVKKIMLNIHSSAMVSIWLTWSLFSSWKTHIFNGSLHHDSKTVYKLKTRVSILVMVVVLSYTRNIQHRKAWWKKTLTIICIMHHIYEIIVS